MIFRPELAKLIKQGKKTQTRRIATTKTCRYEAGKSYAVQPGRGKEAMCRITIMDVRMERLGDLSLKDAKREGFVTTAEFFAYWRGLHGSANPDLMVWVLSFVQGDHTDELNLLAARPGAPHGDYVSQPHLAMREEPEAISRSDAEKYGKLAHARDGQRETDPLRDYRDEIAERLAQMRDHLEKHPNESIEQTVRRLEQELRVLDRKLAA